MTGGQSLGISNDLGSVGGNGDCGALFNSGHQAALIKLVGAAVILNSAVNGDGVAGNQSGHDGLQCVVAIGYLHTVSGDGLVGQVADLHNNSKIAVTFFVSRANGDDLTGQGNAFHKELSLGSNNVAACVNSVAVCVNLVGTVGGNLRILQLIDLVNDLLGGLAGCSRCGHLTGDAVGDVAFQTFRGDGGSQGVGDFLARQLGEVNENLAVFLGSDGDAFIIACPDNVEERFVDFEGTGKAVVNVGGGGRTHKVVDKELLGIF